MRLSARCAHFQSQSHLTGSVARASAHTRLATPSPASGRAYGKNPQARPHSLYPDLTTLRRIPHQAPAQQVSSNGSPNSARLNDRANSCAQRSLAHPPRAQKSPAIMATGVQTRLGYSCAGPSHAPDSPNASPRCYPRRLRRSCRRAQPGRCW